MLAEDAREHTYKHVCDRDREMHAEHTIEDVQPALSGLLGLGAQPMHQHPAPA